MPLTRRRRRSSTGSRTARCSECRLTRIHLEEDTGKSTHAGSGDGRIAGSSYSLVDFNRAGRSADGVRLRAGAAQRARKRSRTSNRCGGRCSRSASATSRWKKARCAAMPTSRSVRPARRELGTKTEIKNMNSFRSVERAIESEIERQIAVARRRADASFKRRAAGTRSTASRIRCAAKKRRTTIATSPIPISCRSRSRAATSSARRRALPTLPWQRFERYTASTVSGAKQATQLIDNLALAEYFDRVVALQRQPAAVEQLRARRPLAARQRDRRRRSPSRTSRPSIWPS